MLTRTISLRVSEAQDKALTDYAETIGVEKGTALRQFIDDLTASEEFLRRQLEFHRYQVTIIGSKLAELDKLRQEKEKKKIITEEKKKEEEGVSEATKPLWRTICEKYDMGEKRSVNDLKLMKEDVVILMKKGLENVDEKQRSGVSKKVVELLKKMYDVDIREELKKG